MVLPTVGWFLFHQKSTSVILHRCAHRAIWSKFLIWGFSTQMTLGCVKATIKANQNKDTLKFVLSFTFWCNFLPLKFHWPELGCMGWIHACLCCICTEPTFCLVYLLISTNPLGWLSFRFNFLARSTTYSIQDSDLHCFLFPYVCLPPWLLSL